MTALFWPAFNLCVLIGLLYWKAKEPFLKFVRERHVSIRDEVTRVRNMLRDAQAKYAEFSAKLQAIDAEVTEIRESTKQEAQAMKSRISAEAKHLSETIVVDARASADALFTDLKQELYAELGTRVLERAEQLMKERLTGDDRARIRNEFSSQVETVQ